MYFIVFGIFTFLSVYHLRFGECVPRFTSVPNNGNPTYADDGSSSFTFDWDYNADGLTVDNVEWAYISGLTNILIAKRRPGDSLQVSSGYSGRVGVTGRATLTLSSIKESDSGTYECRVSFTTIDPARIISLSNFIVVVKPVITRRTTADVTLQEGQSVTLLCTASGNPPPVYTWYRDSIRIQDESSPTSDYTVTAATRRDAGTYKCEASVSGGQLGPYTEDYSIQVTVEFRPEVDILSPNKTEDDGNDVTFTCRAIGVPPVVSYKWFDSGGNEISIDQKFSITSSGNSESRLTITRVTSSDAGQYTCSASNRLGDGQGKSVFLTVNYAPQQVTISPAIPVVKETETITLTCQADGFPTPSYSWRFNGKVLTGADKNTLTFASAEVKDAGNYTCKAQNFRGSSEAKLILNVQYQPKTTTFTTGTPNNAVLQGDKATLSCYADGFPPPTYTIKRNEVVVLSSAARGVYEINSIQVAEESVTYSCESSNSLGDGPQKNLIVTVLVRPSFPNGQSQLPQAKQIKTEGDNITYSCSVDAKPFASILWLLNGQNITETSPYDIKVTYLAAPGKPKIRRTESHLKINGLTWRQHGNFSCFGVNDAGNVSETTELEVRHRPVVQMRKDGPQNKTVSKGESAIFNCIAIGNPPTEEYIWQYNGVNISGSGCTGCRTSLFFKSNLSQDDAGWYSCIGRNTLGFGPPAGAFLFIKRKPEINEFDPDQYIVNETNSVTMVCRAEGVPLPLITWLKSGKNVGSGQRLQISNTEESADGVYTCRARNELGNDTREIRLTVQTRPVILTSTPMATNIAAAAGETKDISCTVKGTPEPTLSWEDENRNTLTPRDANVNRITQGTGIIVMQVVVDTVGETFYCVAVNLLGRSEQKYVIRDRGKPDPPQNLKVTGIKVDNAATVAVNVVWTPGYNGGFEQEFVIEYRKQSSDDVFVKVAVDRQAGSAYTVQGLDPQTVYVFKVFAKNELGTSEATSLAQVKTPASSDRLGKGTVKTTRVGDGTRIVVTWKIEEKNVTAVNLEFRVEGGSWAVVPGTTNLDPTVTTFEVENLKADKMYQFRVSMKKEGESDPVYLYSEGVAPVPMPKEREDEGFKTEWIIAIIAAAAGFLLILIVILCLCCFRRRKKKQGPDRVEMSQTSSYAAGGPNAVHVLDNRRSYGMESVEDDPFIEAHFASVASMTSDGKKKKSDSGVNMGYMSQDSFQPEMLLNPGSRLPRNGRMSQSTGQLDVDSGYPARGPQRDFSTLPPYHEPPSFEEAMRQSGRKPKTRKSTGDLANQPHHNRGGPGPARRSGRRPRQSQGQPADEPTDSSDAEPRFTPHRTAPPPPRFREVESIDDPGYLSVNRQTPVTGPMDPTGSGHLDAPFDPSLPYAVAQKKNKPKPRREEPNGAAVERPHVPAVMYGPPVWRDSYRGWPPPQYTSDDMSPVEPNHYPSFRPRPPSGDLDLDDPSNVPPSERPPDLPPPMAMLPGNRAMPNFHYDYGDGLPEPPAFLRDTMDSPDETEPRYHPLSGRQRKPYVNIHGQLVRPESPDAFRGPESRHSSRNTLSPEPEMPPGNWQPQGSESEEEVPPEMNYVSYLV